MNEQPSGMRPHIVLLGRRNVGKSSLINALTEQPLSLVSEVPGTTTDPVRKAFELLPFGPVVFVDTGGLDDTGELGQLRMERARKELATADFAILVAEAGSWTSFEAEHANRLRSAGGAHIVVVNKIDGDPGWKAPIDAEYVSALTGKGVRALRERISRRLSEAVRQDFHVLSDLVPPGGLAVLVVPIDKEAPRGRLILPQVIAIRDLLDNDSAALVVKERELLPTLRRLGRDPDLVVCDSQVVLRVAGDVPPRIRMTTFSIAFARLKGDLPAFVRGALALDDLKDGDRVLVAEACSHHPIADDIGSVKIPRWVRQFTGRDVKFEKRQGRNYPEDLAEYRLVIHCGGCMITPKVMRARMFLALGAGVPITNYGVAISYVHGVLPRVLEPFGGMAWMTAGQTAVAGEQR